MLYQVLSYTYTKHKEDAPAQKNIVSNIMSHLLSENKVNQVEKLELYPFYSTKGFDVTSAPFIVPKKLGKRGQKNNWKHPLPIETITAAGNTRG